MVSILCSFVFEIFRNLPKTLGLLRPNDSSPKENTDETNAG